MYKALSHPLAAPAAHALVAKLAAEQAQWTSPLPKGKFRGVAVHESFSSYVAEVAEISLTDSGQAKVNQLDVVRGRMEDNVIGRQMLADDLVLMHLSQALHHLEGEVQKHRTG